MSSPTRVSSRASSSRGDQNLDLALQNAQDLEGLESSTFRIWLQQLLDEVAAEADSFGVRFVDDDEMAQLNLRYRDKKETTDVLSFPGDISGDGHHLGDVVIAVACARRQAESRNITFDIEVKTLLIHGVLHCLGYDHETDDGDMNEFENQLRRRWIQDVD